MFGMLLETQCSSARPD